MPSPLLSKSLDDWFDKIGGQGVSIQGGTPGDYLLALSTKEITGNECGQYTLLLWEIITEAGYYPLAPYARGENILQAVGRTIYAESRFTPDARGINYRPDGSVGTIDRGLAQINDFFFSQFTDAQCDDPEFALRFITQEFLKGNAHFWHGYNNRLGLSISPNVRTPFSGNAELLSSYAHGKTLSLVEDVATTYPGNPNEVAVAMKALGQAPLHLRALVNTDRPRVTESPAMAPIGIPKRRALVEIGGFHIIPIGTSGVTRQRQFNPLVVDESLRIRFSITHSFEQNEAPWWIEIYNLANATGQRIIDRGTFFNISAGYNVVGLLCEGVIQNVSISREGQNVLTRLVATGIESAPEISAWMSATWPARTPIRAILEEVARLMGFTLASTAHVPQIANERLRRPYPVNLPAPTVLEFILERYELVASFFCGQLIIDQASPIINPSLPSFEPGHILTDRETALFEQSYSQQIREALAVRTEQAITVNERSGMIGVPKRTETGIEVEMLLNPAISITRLINVESRWLSGIYHLTKVTHSGDTWSGDFRTRAVGEPINQAPTPPFEFRTRSDEGTG